MVVLFLNFSFVNHHKVLRYFVFCFNSAIVTRMHRPSLFIVSGGSCLFSDSDLRLNKADEFTSCLPLLVGMVCLVQLAAVL